MKKTILAILIAIMLVLSACGRQGQADTSNTAGTTGSLGGFDDAYGEELNDMGIYDGHFEEANQAPVITCVSGTAGCYQIDGGTITFTQISEDSVYTISGQLKGNIIIDVGDDYQFDLELHGFTVISDSTNPIMVLSGEEVSITAKKEYENYIYDERQALDETDDSLHSGAIHADVDLEIRGKGKLTVVSEFNNGIHSKDDLKVKNLTLSIICADNALKGNDSVTIENATTTLISTNGDGIKTSKSDISDKGNQRGSVTISGGIHNIYAACDGIDAAYDVVITDDSTVLNIYTDKYSAYSNEITAVDKDHYYIRFQHNSYQYSVKYYNSDEDFCWVDAQYHSTVSGGRTSYYYYSYPIMTGYSKVQFFIYSANQALSQDTEYIACTDYLSLNSAYDTFALTARGNQLNYQWTSYTTTITENQFGPGGPGGPGGMGEGNTDKGDYSTKGIKANNQITIQGGTIAIKSYDDAIHANSDNALENGASPLGNIKIEAGNILLYSNDDGIHADGTLTIPGGNVRIENSYEGLEGSFVEIQNGDISVISSDDGVNATTTSGNAVHILGGTVYIRSGGDGIDSNSRASYTGIVFDGGNTVVISTSGGNSAIDSEQGYTYNGGSVLAIMPNGGMTNEVTHCKDFGSVATRASVSATGGEYIAVKVNSSLTVTVQMPVGINGLAVYLGSTAADIEVIGSSSVILNGNGVRWETSY